MTSYSSAILKKEVISHDNDMYDENINDELECNGWISLPKNSHCNGDDDINCNNNNEELCDHIVHSMTILYLKRRNHKINILGEDAYDRTFHFQNE